jgi:hypothetical protein
MGFTSCTLDRQVEGAPSSRGSGPVSSLLREGGGVKSNGGRWRSCDPLGSPQQGPVVVPWGQINGLMISFCLSGKRAKDHQAEDPHSDCGALPPPQRPRQPARGDYDMSLLEVGCQLYRQLEALLRLARAACLVACPTEGLLAPPCGVCGKLKPRSLACAGRPRCLKLMSEEGGEALL